MTLDDYISMVLQKANASKCMKIINSELGKMESYADLHSEYQKIVLKSMFFPRIAFLQSIT